MCGRRLLAGFAADEPSSGSKQAFDERPHRMPACFPVAVLI
jgi:hypothetical protein